MNIFRRTTRSHCLRTHPRGTAVRRTSTWISTLQVNKLPHSWHICNKPCPTFPHATVWSCIITCLFNDNTYAMGCGSRGWHPPSTSLRNGSPAATPVPGGKKEVCSDENGFCHRLMIFSPWETSCKHHIKHITCTNWKIAPSHSVLNLITKTFYLLLRLSFLKGRKKANSSFLYLILSAFGSGKLCFLHSKLQTFFHGCSCSLCFVCPIMKEFCKNKSILTPTSHALQCLLDRILASQSPSHQNGTYF